MGVCRWEGIVPIVSYLAYAAPSRREALQAELAGIPGCEVVAAKNQEVLVLATDTADEEAETRLQERLSTLASLQCLVMVSAFTDAGTG